MWVGELPSGTVVGLAFSPDAGTLYTGNNHGLLLAWDRSGQRPRQLLQLPLVRGGWQRVDRILPSPDGRSVRVPTGGRLDTLDPATGRPVALTWTDSRLEGATTTATGDLLVAWDWRQLW